MLGRFFGRQGLKPGPTSPAGSFAGREASGYYIARYRTK
jgi:hypothetical protein